MQTVKRMIDNYGRITIPKEFRENLNLKEKETAIVTLLGNNILIRNVDNKCIFCGKRTNILFKESYICDKCVAELKSS